jgi:small nuclear ribonucleoprotein
MADEISTLMGNHQNKMVSLQLRNGSTLQGVLIDFDIHMNLTLRDAEDVSDDENHVKLGKILLRGDNVLSISLPGQEE